MSERNDFSAAAWVKRRLAELHNQLEQTGDLPESARLLWDRVSGKGTQPMPVVDEATVMDLAQAAIDGVDIETSYPVFFDTLVANKSVQAEFLRVLTWLADQRQAESLSPLASRPPWEIETVGGGWRIIWQLTAEQIQAVFDWQRQGAAYRDMAAQNLGTSGFLLLQSRTEALGAAVAVALTAYYHPEVPDALQLAVAVGYHTATPMSIQVQVAWGVYDQAVVVTGGGEQWLPAAALNDLLDETEEHFQHDLRLTVAAHPF